MWQSGTAPPRQDIWGLGEGWQMGGRQPGAGGGVQQQPDGWAPLSPRSPLLPARVPDTCPHGWHGSLSLAPAPPQEKNRPHRVLECGILGFRRGALARVLSRQFPLGVARCGGGERPGWSWWGQGLCPQETGRAGDTGASQGQRANPSGPEGGTAREKSPKDGWLSPPASDRTQLAPAARPPVAAGFERRRGGSVVSQKARNVVSRGRQSLGWLPTGYVPNGVLAHPQDDPTLCSRPLATELVPLEVGSTHRTWWR